MGPQLENGYTKIADAILENIAKSKLNGTQFRILMIVWRSTYGWGKKSYSLSEGYLSKATGIHKQQIKRELKEMIEKGILIEVKSPTAITSREIQFNKCYTEKEVVAKKIPGSKKDTTGGSGLDTRGGSGLDTQNKELNKHIKKQAIEDFFESCWSTYPNKKGKGKISDTKKEEAYKLGDEFTRCIERYKLYLKKNTWLHCQNGSTFWNSGFFDYLDVNEKQDTMKQQQELIWEE